MITGKLKGDFSRKIASDEVSSIELNIFKSYINETDESLCIQR